MCSSATPRAGEKPSESPEELVRFMEGAWRNIQHNESLRNVLLTIYLSIAAGFFVVIRFIEAKGSEVYLSLVAAVIVNAVGLLFVWVFLRFQRMIGRDNQVIAVVRKQLSSYPDMRPIMDVYDQYVDQSRGVLARFPVTVAFIGTIWVTASGVLALSIFQSIEVATSILFGVFLGTWVGHGTAMLLMSRVMGTPSYPPLQAGKELESTR
jgi:hypothetical protein